MKVHNIMEEQVYSRVVRLYEQVQNAKVKANWLTCACEQCQMDTLSYVLNRVPPKYIVSGRGHTHTVTTEDKQLVADIDRLILEGMHAVSSVRRPYHNQAKTADEHSDTPVFNFPTFVGTLYESNAFKPVTDACVTLYMDGKLAEMVDHTWPNPYITNRLTNGAYSFWVKPVPTEKAGANGLFHFSIEVTTAGYEKLTHRFDVPVVSDDEVHDLNTNFTVKIPDLCLFALGGN